MSRNSDSRRYPDAYCFRCRTKVPSLQQKTVILKNNSRAMRGVCGQCKSEVYRLLSQNDRGNNLGTSPSPNSPVSITHIPKTDRRGKVRHQIHIRITGNANQNQSPPLDSYHTPGMTSWDLGWIGIIVICVVMISVKLLSMYF